MSDYNFLLESRLSPEQFQVVNQLGRLASAQGLNLYLVGGAVRDLTYGHQTVRDLDFVLEGNIQKILKDGRLIKQALGLEHEAQKLSRPLTSPKANLPSQVYHMLSDQPLPLLLFLLVHYPHAKIQTRVKNFLLKYPQVRAQLPRGELQSLGVEAGPKFEKILEQVFLDQLDGKLKTHQQLTKALRELAGIKETPPKPPSVRAVAPRHPKSGKAKPARAKKLR